MELSIVIPIAAVSLTFVFIGKTASGTYSVFPTYMFECLYQIYLMHAASPVPIYILTEDFYDTLVRKRLSRMNVSSDFIDHIHVVPIHTVIQLDRLYKDYGMHFPNYFYFTAYARLHVLHAFMRARNLTRVFHMEYDVMLYSDLQHVYNLLVLHQLDTSLIAVRDAPKRALASLMYVPAADALSAFLDFCSVYLDDIATSPTKKLSEMVLLGMYEKLKSFPNTCVDDVALLRECGYFDGATLGQYLGGCDPRTLSRGSTSPIGVAVPNRYQNPSVGFVNVTATCKPNTLDVSVQTRVIDPAVGPLRVWYLNMKGHHIPVRTLHVHSKLLSQFSSLYTMRFTDIITEDRLLQACHIVVCGAVDASPTQHDGHVIIDDSTDAVDEQTSDVEQVRWHAALCAIVVPLLACPHINIGFYGNQFVGQVLALIEHEILSRALVDVPRIRIFIYSSSRHPSVCSPVPDIVDRVFAQNLNVSAKDAPRHALLPIGMRGNIVKLMDAMTSTYYVRKTKGLYINLSVDTHPYRARVLRTVEQYRLGVVSPMLAYENYLEQMGKHRFVLAVRGNGIDTHRFWEALYLQCVPVVINNAWTECKQFLKHVRALGLPFLEIQHFTDFCKQHDQAYFSDALYTSIMRQAPNYMEKLKLGYYV